MLFCVGSGTVTSVAGYLVGGSYGIFAATVVGIILGFIDAIIAHSGLGR